MSPRNKKANQQILDERREQILSAALMVFARRGLAATKISDIASVAGLSHGLIYHYFETKDEIFTELVKRAYEITGIFDYASKLDCSPLKKIQTIIEMIITAAYEGDGLYYWHIVNQAFISEVIPKEVRKLIEKKKTSINDLLVPILIEGQKLGQIVQDDPNKLATAFYSILNGLAMHQMRLRNLSEYPDSLPNADIIIRLLKNPEYKNEINNSREAKSPLRSIRLIDRVFVYRSRKGINKNIITTRTTMIEKVRNDIKVYEIIQDDDTGEKFIALVKAESFQPVYIELRNAKGKIVLKTEYKDRSVVFNIPDRNVNNKEVRIHGDYYDIHTLSFALQGFPYESNKIIELTAVFNGAGGRPIGPYVIEVQMTAREIISVPAGDFDCYKLEMNPVGLGELFREMHKYYYWYSVDEPHFLVKYENKRGNIQELVKFE